NMMAKDPGERYPDWRSLSADIGRVQADSMPRHGRGDEPPLARQAQEALGRQHQQPSAKPAAQWRSPKLLAGAAALAVLAMLFGVFLAVRGRAPAATVSSTPEDGKQPASAATEHSTAKGPAGKTTSPAATPPTGAVAPARATVTATPEPTAVGATPAPEPTPVPAVVPPVTPPAIVPAPVAVAPDANRRALERITLPHTGSWALALSGKGGHVTIPTLAHDGNSPITIEAVVTPMGAGTDMEVVLGNADTGGLCLTRAEGRWQFRMSPNPNAVTRIDGDMLLKRPVHLAGVWDGGQQRLYINGFLVAAANQADRGTTAVPFLLGAGPDSTGRARGASFRGNVECVRITKGVRYRESFALEDALPFQADGDTLCLLDFEEGAGDVAKDASGHGHDGRIANAVWRKMWPSVMPEGKLREVEANLRKANPTAADLLLRVRPLPRGLGLDLGGIANLRDISPLAGLPIVDLELTRTSVSDLSPLRGMRIGWLVVNRWYDYKPTGPGIEDISPLKGMPLVALGLVGHRLVKDLSPIQECPLRYVCIGNNAASDLSPLAGKPLEVLYLEGDAIQDIGPIEGAPLRVLGLAACPSVADLSPISKCTKLEFLWTPVALPPPPAQLTDQLPNLKYLNPDAGNAEAQAHRWSVGRQIKNEWIRSLETAVEGPERAPGLAALTKSILTGRPTKARQHWLQNEDELGEGLTGEQRQAITSQLTAMAGIDRQVLASFRAEVGKTVPIELTRGKVTCQLQGVAGDGIHVTQVAPRGKVARTIRLAELSIAERLHRLGTDDSPERSLQRGMLALEAGRTDVA
ncbi:MAG: hypothetical protein HN380_29750, partial [Victivallales bacterium]|nr:hypothetical protein [Victivallales bacterium]